MQCINCGFENIPGMPACVRCQSALNLGDVDIEPPRASKHAGVRALHRGGDRWRIRLAGVKPRLARAVRWRPIARNAPAVGSVLATVVPGLGHVLEGHRNFGIALFATWAGLFVAVVLSIGTATAWWAFGGMLAVHAMAFTALIGAYLPYEGLGGRMLLGLMVFVVVRMGLYAPVEWLGGQFYGVLPVEGIHSSDFLANGDVLLHEGPWLAPESFARGDLCAYALAGGMGLDRVVGVPGDHIALERGKLLVNGRPPAAGAGPLIPQAVQWTFNYTLSDNHYAILPTQLPIAVHGQVDVDAFVRDASRVARYTIQGRVVLRLRPWSRWGRLE